MSLKKLWRPFNSFLFCFLAFLYPIHQSKAASFIYAGCSPSKFQRSTPYQSNLISLLTSVAADASQATYNSFAVGNNTGSAAGAAVYGLYQCRNDLSAGDCSACVQSAVGQLNLVCPDSYAASLQLDGCFVRYSNENFLGRADTSLVYRKCSASASKDNEFFRRRDDVLADLQNGVGFRVSSSGTVQGYAQCIGDLSSADCTACLAQAIGQLKNSCGSAMAADVYLGQCYAKYWASGYYFRSTTGYSEDDIGKTIAIIVGIFAGVVLFVVFLSFLKKACKLVMTGADPYPRAGIGYGSSILSEESPRFVHRDTDEDQIAAAHGKDRIPCCCKLLQ